MNTNNLTLVPLSIEYAEELLPLWSDYDVIKYTYTTQLSTVKQCEDRIFEMVNREPSETVKDFVILFNGEVIGIAGTPIIDEEARETAFYYQLKRNYWGEGFGYETAKAILNYALKELHMNVVYADAAVANSASIRILRKLGFEETHIEHKGFRKNGMEMNLIHFVMKQEELVGC